MTNGQRAVVTGAGSGIGLEIAKVLQSAGVDVLVSDVSDAALDPAKSAGLNVAVADVTDEGEVEALMDRVSTSMGGLDVLVNNAGIAGPTAPVTEITSDDWQRVFDVNIRGQFLCVKHSVPLLRQSGGGSIINVASIAGRLGMAGRTPYSASKWAVVGFTKSLAIELGSSGIRVNSVLPGAVAGERIEAVISAKAELLGKSFAEVESIYRQQASLGDFITARDVAEAVLFLASPASRMISGQSLGVDGNTEKLS